MFYPVNTKDEKEKEESSHYIYICTKQAGWLENYHKNFEKEIVKLILHEKNQLLLKDDEEEKDLENDMSPYRMSIDIQAAKVKADSGRSKSKWIIQYKHVTIDVWNQWTENNH